MAVTTRAWTTVASAILTVVLTVLAVISLNDGDAGWAAWMAAVAGFELCNTLYGIVELANKASGTSK